MSVSSINETIQIRASINKWISDNFPTKRKFMAHKKPTYISNSNLWEILICAKNLNGEVLGKIHITQNNLIIEKQSVESINKNIDRILLCDNKSEVETKLDLDSIQFVLGDGIEFAKTLDDKSINLLITDPPYGISSPYTCEKQIPRRLRRNGSDFIMPKGHFGDWDYEDDPTIWTEAVLPKVKGWAVIFCAQEQIGAYSTILKQHKFNAVGTFVWQKTNPVPFNHKFKPINAWESMVIGKRPGTQFNGKNVHNLIKYKSPSPQERIHPTQKPVKVIEQLIEYFSNENDLLFDPFSGSASSVIAAINQKRKIIAYEKELEFYKLANKRIRKHIGGLN